MTSLQSKILKIRDALAGVEGLDVFHYWRPHMNAPFCVWQEESTEAVWMGNHVGEFSVSGSIDYFTKKEFDPMVDSIQEAMNTVESLGWSLEAVQYEDETALIHYSWRFEIG